MPRREKELLARDAKRNVGEELLQAIRDVKTGHHGSPRFRLDVDVKAPSSVRRNSMDYDYDRIDEAVLALAYLTLHDGARVWKSFDWDAMGRLHEKGYISDPVNKAKSVALTEQGLKEAERLCRELFCRRDPE
nr:DUF6429 family protein [Peristeroidobacter soli]